MTCNVNVRLNTMANRATTVSGLQFPSEKTVIEASVFKTNALAYTILYCIAKRNVPLYDWYFIASSRCSILIEEWRK
jgi:hypothetical protein